MSRTDPQFNLRIPETLRDMVAASAKEHGRSATAEILARLEISFANDEITGRDLLPADRALALAELSKRDLGEQLKNEINRSIIISARGGHTRTSVSLSDYELANLPPERLRFLDDITRNLEALGYEVSLNGFDRMLIDFSSPAS
ncbi:Arc family DNA-binding protein [Pseudomonas syringae]|uniref:Arc family DNA-binding protein n=1 Tax=Pseudomonas syringae TaxID=317 RepID=UPI001F31C2AB|nr:Arc family DNA-binding protein [Pseudomonas syringae]MCF5708982.1 Arc family DNA-binding protein [Pseudomonas syringae]